LPQLAQWLTWLGGGVTGAGLVLFAGIWGFLATRAVYRPWHIIPYLLIAILSGGFGLSHLRTFFARDFTPLKFCPNPIPANAASIAMGERLYRTHCLYWIQHGMVGTSMPAYKAHLSQEETWHVINYVRQFRSDR
jgi:mono/diheme cytochrome c family protein